MADFNPDAYLATKQAPSTAGQPGANAGSGFDPDAYLKSKQQLVEAPDQTASDSTASQFNNAVNQAGEAYKTYAPVAGQGAAFGYGKQLNAGIQAAAGGLDQVVNGTNNFGDQSAPEASLFQRAKDAISNLSGNYSRAKQGVSEDIQKARALNPIGSALLEIGSSLPGAIASGKALGALGATGSAGAQGAIYSYGASDKEGLDRVLDAAKGGAISAATAGALKYGSKGISALKNADYGKYIEAEYGNYAKPVEDISKLTATAAKDGGYNLDLQGHMKDAFKIGQEYGTALTDPNTQLKVAQELNAQPQIFKDVVKSTRDNLGTKWNALMQQHGDTPVDVRDSLKKAYSIIDNAATEGDATAETLQKSLKDRIKGIEDQLIIKNQYGEKIASSIPLSDVASAQETLGSTIFRDKAYQRVPAINGAAKRVFGILADTFNKADETAGSGGDLSNINKVYIALYHMEDAIPSGATIKALTDPQALAAQNKYSEFVKPFEKLSPDLRDTLAPQIHDYLANKFPTALAKAKTMLAVTERGGQQGSGAKQLLSLAGLRNLANASEMMIANKIGAATTSPLVQGTQQSLKQIGQGINASLPTVAPSIGSLMTNGSGGQ